MSFIIEPVIKESIYSVKQLEWQPYKENPNSEWENNKGDHDLYESEIQNVNHNLDLIRSKKRLPLGLNKTFVLKVEVYNRKEHAFVMNDSNEKKTVKEWLLLRVDESKEDVFIKPGVFYYLSTIIEDKFYFLHMDDLNRLSRSQI